MTDRKLPEFFKPSDFEKHIHGHECPIDDSGNTEVWERPDLVCKIANQILAEHLKGCPVVRGVDFHVDTGLPVTWSQIIKESTHRAYLFGVERIGEK